MSTTGSLVRSFLKLALQPTVVDRDRILLASLSGPVVAATPAATLERLDSLMSHMRAQPGVQSVSVSTFTPMSGLIVLSPIDVPGRVNRDPMARAVALNRVTPEFFRVFGIPLLTGRTFDERDDAHAPGVAIVNPAFERQFLAGEAAVGRRIRLAGREVTIVGVVATAKYMDLRESTRSVAYLPLTQGFRADPQPLRFGIRTESVDRTRGLILAALRRLDPRFLVEFRTLYDEVASSISRERTLAWAGGLIGALALLLAGIGLYGAFSYMTTRRRGEFAIRLAVGADAASIRLLVARSVARVFSVGAAFGCAAVFALARLVESQLFGVRAGDVGVLAVSLGVTALVAVVATAGPARAAGRADPARCLRAQ